MRERARNVIGNAVSNNRGQMSVFLALVFQVLFVFFAMVINIGLMVHDKINLQNSVDLGAYYAAQKQAEILNEIAHLNYQIRQEYKLLAWRYWVLGTLGRDGQGLVPPPQMTAIGSALPEAARRYSPPGGALQEEVPIACLANAHWWEFAMLSQGRRPNENYCWRAYNTVTSSIPVNTAISTPATIGVNISASLFARASRREFSLSCINASPLSWAFVASIMADYRLAIAYRKRAIKRLTANLASEVPLDQEGKSIREGVIATIEKNLTESNRQGFNRDSVQMLNGLSLGECAQGAYPGERTIKEILTVPGLYFSLLTAHPSGGCAFDWRFQTQYRDIIRAGGDLPQWDPKGTLRAMVDNEPQITDDTHSSLGFEKNPWCMAYVGVKAQTSSRKPFAPFGRASTLVARAFAQPFGGRIGPWYAKGWPRGQLTSGPVPAPAAGAAILFNGDIPDQNAVRTDPLTSPRRDPTAAGGYSYSALTIPNFSRFPGDRLGMRSMRMLGSSRHYFRSYSLFQPALNNITEPRPRLFWFMGFPLFPQSGDSLAYDHASGAVGVLPAAVRNFRQIEMAAVAPNLFDTAYYSIEANANLTYLRVARGNRDRYAVGSHELVGDLGLRHDTSELAAINVESQIAAANGGGGGAMPGLDPSLRPSLFWVVQQWQHLLTGWAPHRVTTFTFPRERFGICNPGDEAAPSVMIPGKCAAGGRVGYSVRLISRAHLRGNWTLGGSDPNVGPLINPPPDDSVF